MINRRTTPQSKAPWVIAKGAGKPPAKRKWGEKATKPALWTSAFPPKTVQDASQRRPSRIRSVSKRQARLNATYAPLAAAFKIANPWCKCCPVRGLTPEPTNDVHHVRGRGKFFLDQTTWLPVCRGCHTFIDANRAWAYSVGMLELRLNK